MGYRQNNSGPRFDLMVLAAAFPALLFAAFAVTPLAIVIIGLFWAVK